MTEKFIAGSSGGRLDVCLSDALPQFSRAEIARFIKAGLVTVNGRRRKPAYSVKPGDEIAYDKPEKREPELVPLDKPLTILYEDAWLAVVEKEVGVVCHPAPGHADDTLANILLAHFGEKLSSVGGPLRRGIVHRLDRDTSGLLMVAKTDAIHLALAEALKRHEVTRIYDAITDGVPETETGVIDAPLGRDPVNRQRMAVVTDGKNARTQFWLRSQCDRMAHLQLKLETGRTHQIRVHMKMIGCPVLNDALYGRILPGMEETGLFLHASKLTFVHPIDKKEMTFQSDNPERFDYYFRKRNGAE